MLRKEFQPIDMDSLCRKAKRLSGQSQQTREHDAPLPASFGAWLFRTMNADQGQMTPVRVPAEQRKVLPHR